MIWTATITKVILRVKLGQDRGPKDTIFINKKNTKCHEDRKPIIQDWLFLSLIQEGRSRLIRSWIGEEGTCGPGFCIL